MKFGQLVIGLLLGGLLGLGLSKYVSDTKQQSTITTMKSIETLSSTAKWVWPDSLDAMKAAPENHKLVYEDNDVRVLAVMLDGKQSEPIHTHKWKSIMWIAKPIVPCKIYKYQKGDNGKLVKSDSLLIKEMPIDIGQLIGPEGPTSITNLGSESGVAYRVEFKRGFRP